MKKTATRKSWHDHVANPAALRRAKYEYVLICERRSAGEDVEFTEYQRYAQACYLAWRMHWRFGEVGKVHNISDTISLHTIYQYKVRAGLHDQITDEEREANRLEHLRIRNSGTPEQIQARKLAAKAASDKWVLKKKQLKEAEHDSPKGRVHNKRTGNDSTSTSAAEKRVRRQAA